MRKMRMIIAIDFDGTCVTHKYPEIGDDIGAVPALKRFVTDGHLLILNTIRDGPELEDAVNWFKKNDISLYAVNKNHGQENWTKSPKVYANMYIDNLALGCPCLIAPGISERAFVDWKTVEKIFYDGISSIPNYEIISKRNSKS